MLFKQDNVVSLLLLRLHFKSNSNNNTEATAAAGTKWSLPVKSAEKDLLFINNENSDHPFQPLDYLQNICLILKIIGGSRCLSWKSFCPSATANIHFECCANTTVAVAVRGITQEGVKIYLQLLRLLSVDSDSGDDDDFIK